MEGVVEVKGRVAAEIQSADELVLTELIFSGAFKVETGQHQELQRSCQGCRISSRKHMHVASARFF